MKKIITMLALFPFLLLAQQIKDTTENKIVLTMETENCVNKIYDNPDAIKYLLQKLAADKEKFREIKEEIMNDPAMKDIIREIRQSPRQDGGMLDKNKLHQMGVNKSATDLTYGGNLFYLQ